MNTPKLSIQLVTWNGAEYIPYLFESLKNQSYTNWTLSILDNASSDETVSTIKKQIQHWPVSVNIIEQQENIGFAGGHNTLFHGAQAEYVLLLNQDMYVDAGCLEQMVGYMEAHKTVAVVSPRLMRWNFNMVKTGGRSQLINSFSDDIDAIGLKVFRNRRVVEWMTKHTWSNNVLNKQSQRAYPVFGVSGAFPLFRRSALTDILFSDETIFDTRYHSYKEDVDVAFRLRSRNHSAYILLDSVAYHDRSGAGPKEMTDNAAIMNKKNQSSWVKYHSYKNHLRTLYKNEYGKNLLLDFPWILWYEAKKFLWLLLAEPKVLLGISELWTDRKDIKEKRQYIQKHKIASAADVRKWWTQYI